MNQEGAVLRLVPASPLSPDDLQQIADLVNSSLTSKPMRRRGKPKTIKLEKIANPVIQSALVLADQELADLEAHYALRAQTASAATVGAGSTTGSQTGSSSEIEVSLDDLAQAVTDAIRDASDEHVQITARIRRSQSLDSPSPVGQGEHKRNLPK